MHALWNRLEAWLQTHVRNASLKLRPAASEEAIAAAEARLGIAFPDDFRESLLVHDGQEDEPPILWLPFAHRLGSLQSIVACHETDLRDSEGWLDEERMEWMDPDRKVRQIYYHPSRLPFAGSTYWDYDRLEFDFVPGPDGSPGQIVVRWEGDYAYLTTSFRSLMEQTVDGLERGRIVLRKVGGDPMYRMQVLTPRSRKPTSPFEYFE